MTLKLVLLARLKVNAAGNFVSETISDALVKGLNKSDLCLLVCGAKRNNIFFIFGPHSRGKDGLLHHSGTAVLVSFTEIQHLIVLTERLLMQSLRLKSSEQFELVSLSISMQSNTAGKTFKKPCSMATTYTYPQFGLQGPSKTHSKAQSTAEITEKAKSEDKQNKVIASDERAMESYFADQKRRDNLH